MTTELEEAQQKVRELIATNSHQRTALRELHDKVRELTAEWDAIDESTTREIRLMSRRVTEAERTLAERDRVIAEIREWRENIHQIDGDDADSLDAILSQVPDNT